MTKIQMRLQFLQFETMINGVWNSLFTLQSSVILSMLDDNDDVGVCWTIKSLTNILTLCRMMKLQKTVFIILCQVNGK